MGGEQFTVSKEFANGVRARATEGLQSFSGLRVLEIGSWLAVPSATAMLADLGAEVVKVEGPEGDPSRRYPPPAEGESPSSAAFEMLNRGKRSIVLDLGTSANRQRLEGLLKQSDVLVTNLRLHQAVRLGLDHDTVLKRYPGLIVANLTAFGLRGPDADLRGFDVGAFWARSGLLAQITPEGGEPGALAGGYGDLMTSLALFAAIVTGLFERSATGKGGLVETSLLQTAAFAAGGDLVSLQAYGRMPRVRSRLESRTPLNNSYQAADGRWFFLTCVDSVKYLAAVSRVIGRPEIASDERWLSPRGMAKNAPALIALLDECFAGQQLDYWRTRIEAEGVLWQCVATPGDLLDDPQIAANGMLTQLSSGYGKVASVVAPFRVFEAGLGEARPAPGLGEHNAFIAPSP